MSDQPSVYQDFLCEMHGSLNERLQAAIDGPLMQEIKRAASARAAADRRYLASLSVSERQAEMMRRRIADVERRYHDWWETHMGWRFRRDPPPEPDYGDW